MNKQIFRRALLGSIWGVATAGLGLASAAYAQTSPDASATKAEDASTQSAVDEIIVTGSRLLTSPFNSPTPVAVVDEKLIKSLNINNVGDVLNQMPSFRPSTTPASNFFQVGPAISARTMDLRGLGQTRTLVLLDGQRTIGANDLGTVDMNTIPSSLIARTEVVTGGASAAYGADAVSGVVNLILDTSFTGLKADVNYGESQRGDNKSFFASMAAGTKFASGRGHVMIGMEYSREDGIGDCSTRSWCSKITNYIPNPAWSKTGGNTLPATIVSNNAQFVLNYGGLVPSGALKGIQFDPQGNPLPFTFGQYFGSTFMVGGDPSVANGQIFAGQPLTAPNKHFSALAHADYELTDTITASLTFNYAWTEGGPVGTTRWYDFSRSIPIDNAYLTTATRNLMTAAGVTSIPVNHYVLESPFENLATSKNDTYRLAFKLKGDIGGGWEWDFGAQYGLTKSRLDALNIRQKARWAQAIDAVVAPNGTIVCRSTLTNPGNGCIPINYLGQGNVTQAAIDWVKADAWQTRHYDMVTAEANVRGPLFEGWAGTIKGAVGVNYRKLKSRGNADALSRAGALQLTVASTLLPVTQEVKEAYAEINVPVLANLPLVESLDVDGAVRLTDYSQFGTVTTWKAGVVYRPSSDFMFRFTRSRDSREPNAQELNPLSTSIQLPLTDPKTNSNYIMQSITTGNPNLDVETANTLTIGGVFTPHFIPALRLSVDYYDIKMSNAIDVISPQATLTLCSNGVAVLCNFINRNSTTGLVTSVTSTYQNLSQLHASGLEGVLNYSTGLGKSIPGKIDFTLNANAVDKLEQGGIDLTNWTGNPGTVTNIRGVPNYRLTSYLTYSNDTIAMTLSSRYIPKARLDNTKIGPEDAGYSPDLANSITTNRISSRFYLDLSGSYKFKIDGGTEAELYGLVTNLLDKSPPATLRIYGNPLYFDPIGRSFKVGLRIRR